MLERLLPVAASSHAPMLDLVLRDIHWHMLAIFVVWAIVLLVALVRFRQGRQAQPRRDGVRGLWPVLAIGAVVFGDVVILTTRALPAWSARMAPPPAASTPLEVRITAEQFAWNIHYAGPDGAFGRTSATLRKAGIAGRPTSWRDSRAESALGRRLDVRLGH